MNPSTNPKSDARRTALIVLNKLNRTSLTLDSIMADILDKDYILTKQDRALANAIVYGVLRWQGQLDWIIKHFSKTKINKIDPSILNILRIGIFQILYLDRIPNSAAVNTSVELAKTTGPKWIAGYVNGILRNVVRHHEKVAFPDIRKDPVLALATSKSFPQWLIKRWLKRFGLDETIALCDSINTIPPITLRVNTLPANREKCIASLIKEKVAVSPTYRSPFGLNIENLSKPIHELEAFQKGLFQVQDEAAQLATMLLNPLPGETILDACAGLGGKTALMAQLMENKGNIVAMDWNKRKLEQLNNDMKRLGITIVETRLHDVNTQLPKTQLFDRILLDAPCSGLGVLRRNPDTKWSRTQKDLKSYKKQQLALLHNLAPLLKPNGKLLYVVCSFEPEENEEVIRSFLKQHADFKIKKHIDGFPENANSFVDKDGFFKTYPHSNCMDGFFAVYVRKSR